MEDDRLGLAMLTALALLAYVLGCFRVEAVEVRFTFPDESLEPITVQACEWLRCPEGLPLIPRVEWMLQRLLPGTIQTLSAGHLQDLESFGGTVEVRP